VSVPATRRTPAAEGGPESSRPRLLWFYSRVSGRARRVEGFVANVLQRRQNHETFTVQRVVVEDHPDLAKRFEIGGEPTLLVVADNQVQGRLENPRGTRDIEAFLAPWLKPARNRSRRDS
jgi:hypothetical protein